jgi:hypothetical protein
MAHHLSNEGIRPSGRTCESGIVAERDAYHLDRDGKSTGSEAC